MSDLHSMIHEPITFPWTLTVYELGGKLWIHHSQSGFVNHAPVDEYVINTLVSFANGTINGVREVIKHNPKASIAWDAKIKMIKTLRILFNLDLHAGKVFEEFLLEGKEKDESGRQIVFWFKFTHEKDHRHIIPEFRKNLEEGMDALSIMLANTEEATPQKQCELENLQGFRVNS